MGKSNAYLFPIYRKSLKEINSPTALLGFTDIPSFIENGKCDLYDLQLGNWNINNDWELNKKYKSIVCTRCLHFCKNPKIFFEKCYNYLEEDGMLFVDFSIGDAYRFKNYKIGWVKNEEHEWGYFEDNYLWSTVWDESFVDYDNYKLFEQWIKKFSYENVKEAIFKEVPSIIELDEIKKLFNVSVEMKALWEDSPQLYIFLTCTKQK